jgi:hypothetical protein
MLLASSVRNGPKMGSAKEEWERECDQEWLFEWPEEERGGKEDIAREGEAGEGVEVEEN